MDKKIYEYKGKRYTVFCETIFKNDEDIWIPVVIYEAQYDNPDGKYFVRRKEKFYNDFKLITN